MKVKAVKIDTLALDSDNARKHSDRNLLAIKESLSRFGQRKPIVVRGSKVLAGNGTLEAARALGWTEIQIAEAPDDWDEDTAKAYALADNRTAELAEWDESVLARQLLELEDAEWDIEALGFELPKLHDVDVDEDEIPEPPVEPITKVGDIWQLGRHRLMCGDSTDEATVARLMDGAKADMVFTDPPYGISVVKNEMVGADFGVAKKGQYAPVLGDQDGVVARTVIALALKLWPKAKQIWWGANHYAQTASLPDSSCWLVWDKRAGTEITNTFADAELAWTNMTSPVRIHRQLWNGMIRSGEHEKRVHPTQKPVNLCAWAMDEWLVEHNVVDLFGGSGSTLIAAEQLGKTCYMMELDPKYCDVIMNRWQTLTGQTATLLTKE